ncbi:MAG: hypothetical protein HKO66_12375 [Saprospiraceae bacterium]|nr:hypothetical protein [Bacteroidia bacterium]NNE14459.1 hypothetical protein [Saprospiraceae bacterium]NNL93026.1 hypothetical protein [Saprospiraceae bacterium]
MKSDNTSSFVIRFTQKIFDDAEGKANIQWRGKISHVQGGDQKSFSEFEDAIAFMQDKLSDLTKASVASKSTEEKEGLLSKSFDIWKKVAKSGPKMVMDVIKDPKGQVSQFQDQISQVGDELSQKIELDDWKMASKSDYKSMMQTMEKMAKDISKLSKKIDKLSKTK